MSPRRIQRRRVKGWRLPPGAVIVTRGSKWGNPYRVGGAVIPVTYDANGHPVAGQSIRVRNAAHAVELFRASIKGREAEIVADLAGKDLCCWCHTSQPCHADVLLEIANGRP